ncbi:hypothetical protein EIP86_009059 [Pleurotus ostreatoroseus]|nr:hypothetical protein EIP86_009059 [Pleurotus ostreatoroseus]
MVPHAPECTVFSLRLPAAGIKPPSTWAVFADIYRREGLAGINKGVNAVAVRQCTNWGLRMGFARLAESTIRKVKGKGEGKKLSALEKIHRAAKVTITTLPTETRFCRMSTVTFCWAPTPSALTIKDSRYVPHLPNTAGDRPFQAER